MSDVPHWVDRTTGRSRDQVRGFTLLELILVIILVAALFLVAGNRLLPLRGEAEAAHVTTVVGSLRSALGMEAAARAIREDLAAVQALAHTNPFDLLQRCPENYLGVMTDSESGEPASGSWYFDPESSALVYRVRYPRYLEGRPDGPVELRWRIESQQPRGIALIALHDVRWKDWEMPLRQQDPPGPD